MKRYSLGLLILIIIGWANYGCRHRTDPGTQFREGRRVASITFSGNRALTDDELRKYLPIQRRDTYLEESETAVFDILLQLYAAKGYHDTKIIRVDVRSTPRGWVHLRVHLLEGQPSLVRLFAIKWQSPVTDAQKYIDGLALQKGDVASVEKLNEAVKQVKSRLANDGYALATVRESMIVTRDEYAADVILDVDAKAVCTIERFYLHGLEHAPYDLVYRELEEFEGLVYTPKVEDEIESNLSELNAFRLITVSPVERPDNPGVIDVDVSLVEANFQNLKIGVGGQFETNKFLGWTSAVYQHNNFMRRLNQFQLRAKLGWALVPSFWDVEDKGPVTLIEPSVTRKGFLEKRLVWNMALGFQTDVEENYKLFSPSGRLSVSRPFLKRLNIRLSYNFEYIVLYGLNDEIMRRLQADYEDMRSPIRLADVNVNTLLWLTDSRDNPNNGVVLQFDFWHSGPYLASEVAYHKVRPTISAYWRPFSFFQIALHGEVGFIYPIGSKDYSGIRANFFLGGHNTVRGWGGKRLAPSVDICLEPTEESPDSPPRQVCEKIWIGGKTMVQGNAEFRFRVSKAFSVITFLDMGDVQYEVNAIKASLWNYSVGSGIRIHTPVGKIRFDVGYRLRLNNSREYRDEPAFGVHLGLGEAF
ncbi:MAG: BamA/TamA family outer membrane protein [Deltaproteobacteria bacterium]|nr:BamA/TamA family outer membrane protein [Deltaproteobacteria bacterium]